MSESSYLESGFAFSTNVLAIFILLWAFVFSAIKIISFNQSINHTREDLKIRTFTLYALEEVQLAARNLKTLIERFPKLNYDSPRKIEEDRCVKKAERVIEDASDALSALNGTPTTTYLGLFAKFRNRRVYLVWREAMEKAKTTLEGLKMQISAVEDYVVAR